MAMALPTCAVAGAGDVNGDSFADVIVGAPHAPTPSFPDSGTATVYLSGADGALRVGGTLLGSRAFGAFGESVGSGPL